MQIRPAEHHDVVKLAELHIASWRLAYREALSPEYLQDQVVSDRHTHWQKIMHEPLPGQQVLIAEQNQRMLGFVCFYLNESAEWGSYIHNLHVAEAEHGKGVAAQLMQAAAKICLQACGDGGLYLWVLQTNVRAQRFYQKCGGVRADSEIWHAPGGTEAATDRYYWGSTASLISALQQANAR